MHNAELFLKLTVVESEVYYLLSFRAGDCKDHFRHSEPAQAGEESHRWLRRGNDNGSENLLSFSRSARESPGWFCHGDDGVLLCPSVGDCVVAKSAQLSFHLTAKASLAPLLLLFGRDPLRWVRGRGGG